MYKIIGDNMSITKYTKNDNQFYPTPKELAEKLLDDVDWKFVNDVLEPSCGKGDLILHMADIVNKDYRTYINVDGIEIDSYLRSICNYRFHDEVTELLSKKNSIENKKYYDHNLMKYVGLTEEDQSMVKELKYEIDKRNFIHFHLVHDDFLTFDSRKKYDLIIMNPPFENGDKHLLKAIDIAEKYGGEIRCILNAETILNPFSNSRKLLQSKLEKYNADISFVENGFKDAERKTGVEVAIIKISVMKSVPESDIYNRLKSEENERFKNRVRKDDVTDVVVSDFIERIVSQYNVEVDAGIELIEQYEALKPYILNGFNEDKYNSPMITLKVGKHDADVNQYINSVRKKYWTELFNRKEFTGKFTNNLRDKYLEMVSNLINYDFSIYNINQISIKMMNEMVDGIKETILNLFDKMSKEYSWYPETKNNIHYYNGWKSNKAHKVSNKVIMPIHGIFSDYSWCKETFKVYEAERTISDIEKVFDYLDDGRTSECSLHGVLERACQEGKTRKIHCKYFDVSLFKKGTMHIQFTNLDILERFNIYAAMNRDWLPPYYGKVRYEDLSEADRGVINEFQGKEGYYKVMSNTDYFLSDPCKVQMPLLIEA